MKNVLLFLLTLSLISCSSIDQEASPDRSTLMVLGNGKVFYQENLLSIDELDTYLTDFDEGVLHIQLERFVSTGDVTDVTNKLRELSVKKITISEKSSFKVYHFEIIGDGKIVINDEVMSLSALESNLKVIDTQKELYSFVSIKNDAPMGDVMFAMRLIHKNNTAIVKIKKADS